MCDVLRVALMLLVAIPDAPVVITLALLFVAHLPAHRARPPSRAHAAGVDRDRLVLGLSINASVGQAAQVVGYLFGAALAAVQPSLALLVPATTFALVRRVGAGRRPRPCPAMAAAHRSTCCGRPARDSGWCSATRRCGASPCWCSVPCSSPSCRGAGRGGAAEHAGDGPGCRPGAHHGRESVGFILGGLIIAGRCRRHGGWPWSGTLAVCSRPCCWYPLLDPAPQVVALLSGACGSPWPACCGANGVFVRALPAGFRPAHSESWRPAFRLVQALRFSGHRSARERFSIRWCRSLERGRRMLMCVAALSWPAVERSGAPGVHRRTRGSHPARPPCPASRRPPSVPAHADQPDRPNQSDTSPPARPTRPDGPPGQPGPTDRPGQTDQPGQTQPADQAGRQRHVVT